MQVSKGAQRRRALSAARSCVRRFVLLACGAALVRYAFYRLMKPTMTKSTTAPITALTIEPMKPENGTNPNCVSSQTPMKAPMMPMMMS
jgi:hypothetical protein